MHTQTLSGATILITGGTGSFGNRVAAHLLKHNPKEIRIYSRDEKKQWEMQRHLPGLRYILGDVRDFSRLSEAMRGVDFVFHARPSSRSAPTRPLNLSTRWA
jgi:UDP-N-acetylglucosamine 4,6-dehydratase